MTIIFDLLHVVMMMMKQNHQQRKNPKLGQFVHDVMNQIFYVEIGKQTFDKYSPLFHGIGCRFIPRRIDLDRDYALDTLVAQNLQIQSRIEPSNNGQIVSIEQQQLIRQQRRTHKRTNQQTQSDSSKKTLELLEHFMPQNRRIYNFGVKTLKPRPIGWNMFM